jgi:hypothetical protein
MALLIFLYRYKLTGVRKISNEFRARRKALTARIRGATFQAELSAQFGPNDR